MLDMSLGFTTLFHSTLQQFSPTKTRHFSYKNQTFFGPSPTKTRHFSYKNLTFFCLSYKNQTFFGTHFTSLPNNSLSSLRESFYFQFRTINEIINILIVFSHYKD